MSVNKISEEEAYVMYDDMLNEVYEPFMGTYDNSLTLKAVDPIAYQVGFTDWLDANADSIEVEGY